MINLHEMARFLISGVAATVANLAAVLIARNVWPYGTALLAGIAAGATVSFVLSKLFVFRSRRWAAAQGELARFTLVYAFGLVLYWGGAMVVHPVLARLLNSPVMADGAGVLFGAALMLASGYFGHRFITYRSTRDGYG